jgi:SAM-dependent methyltransferase
MYTVRAVDATELNRAHWDALARVHGTDGYYDAEALIADRLPLGEVEAAGDVSGLDVMHLQCHLGFDAIRLARLGARVTGVDFSAGALAKASALAADCGVAVEWVQADATALPEALHGRFDVVYATIGVLCWIADLDAWMREVFTALRPGGRLVLVEIHPLLQMFESFSPPRVDFPYAFDGPRAFDLPGSYADPDADVAATASVEYGHSLGEIVTAALAAGLRVEALREHMDAERDHRGDVLTLEADGRYRARLDGEPIPVLFTLIASRP